MLWFHVALAGIPHSTMHDDTYNGMFIPKGTMVFANAWYVMRCLAHYRKM